MKLFSWMKPQGFLKEDQIQVFKNKIEPDDIEQGSLGDCYFLSTLSAISEFPDRILKIFTQYEEVLHLSESERLVCMNEKLKECIKYGIFSVQVYDSGELKEILVDDLFPVIKYNNGSAQPCFSKSREDELWVMILEKVWAKIYGSYNQIVGGNAQECLHDLTGAPTKYIFIKNQDQIKLDSLWADLFQGDKNNFIISCSSNSDTRGVEAENDKGIIGGHAYTIISCYEITDLNQNKIRLLKIRNPWADHEWKGKWADNSAEWMTLDENLRQNVLQNMTFKDDGVFFIQFEDFVKFYRSIQICMYYDNFKYNFIKVNSSIKKGNLFQVIIQTPGKYFFTINQTSQRKFSKEQQKTFNYAVIKIILAKQLPNGSLQFIEDVYRNEREVWTCKEENDILQSGIYFIYAKVQWNRSQSDNYTLSCYGQDNVIIQQTNKITNQTFLENVFLNHALKFLKKIDEHCQYAFQQSDGHQYFAIFNNNQNQVYQITLILNKIQGTLTLKKPYKKDINSPEGFQLEIQPGQSKIVLATFKGFSAGFGISWKNCGIKQK